MREQQNGAEELRSGGGRRQRRPFILKRPIVALNGGGGRGRAGSGSGMLRWLPAQSSFLRSFVRSFQELPTNDVVGGRGGQCIH